MANASGFRGQKQTNGYFVPLNNCVNRIFQYNGASGAGGSFLPGVFTTADWTVAGTGAGALLSSISSIGQGGLLRDMGRTVVSSNRTFRKVQLVTPSANAGVTGFSTSNGPYYTGYIELGTGNSVGPTSTLAPVAYMPGLI
jgi:hypothetical protein